MDAKQNNEEMTQAEVAKVFGVTRGAVQVVERNALEKLRKLVEQRKINKDDYLGDML